MQSKSKNIISIWKKIVCKQQMLTNDTLEFYKERSGILARKVSVVPLHGSIVI